ncbi:GNAT family N-acetyltransferase [Phenylobacterium sp. J367]|uniref:GNAT family N-acetyltransferase n=1 Tax=Phenylobacterium sp. J367 TaxID=2898435 RepID=UPI002150E039|nr:GNAT family N-acetyltransferase [Phenylobacterium sp. J367]MCR5880628.1 GNAT family N-acetyltransferase [Phenylobacterium sp. J367]
MSSRHPLDRPIWTALSGRQSGFALGDGPARRIAADVGVFVAAEDDSPASLEALAELVRMHGESWRMEVGAAPVPGTETITEAKGMQMVADRLTPAGPPAFAFEALADADAPEMLELALLTKPGPFAARTHQLGDFVGVRRDGRLIAMAGERLRPEGFTEVSGVCTLPEHRGQGYAAGLMRHVAGRILDRGETPFLHAYATNTGAIGLYETLGFRIRTEVTVTALIPARTS